MQVSVNERVFRIAAKAFVLFVFLIFIGSLSNNFLQAQNQNEITKYYYAFDNNAGKSGFIDGSGKVAIPAMYDHVVSEVFSENDLTMVGLAGKYFMINARNERVFAADDYDWIDSFGENGTARFQAQNGKWGIIDKQGVEQVSAIFDHMDPINESGLTAAAFERKWGFIDDEGKWIITPQYDRVGGFNTLVDLALFCQRGRCGFLNKKGEVVIPSDYEYAASFDRTGYACVKKDGEWGFISNSGALVSKEPYEFAYPFGDGMLAAAKKDGKWGYVDTNFVFQISPQFEAARAVSATKASNLIPIMKNGKWGYVDHSGHMMIEPSFDSAFPFYNQQATAVEVRGKWGFINKEGAFIVQPMFSDVSLPFKKGEFTIVNFADRKGVLNLAGEFFGFTAADVQNTKERPDPLFDRIEMD